jgi:hypothetical protein
MLVLLMLLIALPIVGGIIDAHSMTNRQEVVRDFIIKDVPKNCPPHKWRHQEVKDLNGNTLKWKMVCDICGPLKPIEDRSTS